MINITLKKIITNIFLCNSLESAMRKLLGRKRFALLKLNYFDWRETTSLAAKIFGIQEDYIIEYVALKMRIPVIRRIPDFDTSKLPEKIEIEDLKRMGCVPFYRDKILCGVICVDPRRASILFSDHKDLSYALSSWTLINESLNKCHRESQDRLLDKKHLQLQRDNESALQVIRFITRQVSNYGSSSFELNFQSTGAIKYNFQTLSNKNAQGDVSRRISGPLRDLLASICDCEIKSIFLNDKQKIELHADKNTACDIFYVKFSIVDCIESKTQLKLYNHENKSQNSIHSLAMIVDDNHCFAKVLDRFLSKQGIASVHAENGKEALARLESLQRKPDILICDLNMPQMNGIELISNMRSHSILKFIPAIILTSEDDLDLELKAISGGADTFLNKTEDPRLLSVKIERLIEASRRYAA